MNLEEKELDSLIIQNDEVVYLNINEISPNKEQPRKKFDEESIKELSNSISLYGVIQPIIVRQKNGLYEIIAGERRWRASRIAGLKKIPAIVKDIEELEATQIALVENIQRENLNPIEEALSFKALIDRYNLTQEKIGQVLGKSRPYIANTIRLLNLNEKVIYLISEGKISSGHGRAILGLKDDSKQIKLSNLIISKNLSVRETENLVREMNIDKKIVKKQRKEDGGLQE